MEIVAHSLVLANRLVRGHERAGPLSEGFPALSMWTRGATFSGLAAHTVGADLRCHGALMQPVQRRPTHLGCLGALDEVGARPLSARVPDCTGCWTVGTGSCTRRLTSLLLGLVRFVLIEEPRRRPEPLKPEIGYFREPI
jgi:hypothetical protein